MNPEDPTEPTKESDRGRRNAGLHPDFVSWANNGTGYDPEKAVENLQKQARPREQSQSQLWSMPYHDYLRTDHWREVRRAALERAEDRCQLCNSPNHLEVHHRTYERRGAEHESDVVVLCDKCHGQFHKTHRGFTARKRGHARSIPILIAGLAVVAFIGASILLVRSVHQTNAAQRANEQEGTAAAQTEVSRSVYAAAATTNASIDATKRAIVTPMPIPTSPPTPIPAPTMKTVVMADGTTYYYRTWAEFPYPRAFSEEVVWIEMCHDWACVFPASDVSVHTVWNFDSSVEPLDWQTGPDGKAAMRMDIVTAGWDKTIRVDIYVGEDQRQVDSAYFTPRIRP
ncbi:MAG: HNH endonuclease signature motif containing protein [Thermomicrobiales bacterium]